MAGRQGIKKVVLAYSGGLDTSVIIPWLREHHDCEVVAFAADLGQEEELDGLEEKALKTGASKLYVRDVRDEFVRDFIWPTLRAGAVYEHKYLLGTSFARPLIARHQVEIARLEGADAVAHGATGKGNDQVRFELTYKALAPELTVIAPWREWTLRSREDLLAYAAARQVPVAATATKIYSRDRNIWHLSHEAGVLEDPWNEPPEDMYQLTRSPEQAPDTPVHVTLAFEQGTPVAVDGEALGPAALVTRLNAIGAEHGIGRVDLVENRLVGMKSRGVYETPGGTIIYTAHRETLHYKQLIGQRYAELVYNGQWYTPLRAALDAFVAETQKTTTGEVRLKLYKGSVQVAGRRSPFSLYREDLATMSQDEVYNQKEAEGFINLFGLPLKVQALTAREHAARPAGD
jgi:argininosuccinate synthase